MAIFIVIFVQVAEEECPLPLTELSTRSNVYKPDLSVL